MADTFKLTSVETVNDNPQNERVEVVNQGDKMSNNEGGIVENDGRVENNSGLDYNQKAKITLLRISKMFQLKLK